ncbi:TPA: hypothetical protein H1012_00045 [archaeon]|nr:hypothetical protein [Candidatus Naiadarchaeales archaeon SRR2090153.bin461]HIK02221.1 hypothetical protein [Candidatus Naiadarchaeales archaeon SRR2090159.bin1288]
MRSNKGFVGELIIFVAVAAIAAGFVYTVYLSGNQTAAEVYFSDDLRSISLVADAVVNSPNCLLYTEKDLLFQPPKISSTRGIIDSTKISDQKKDCVRKGPYIWNAKVWDIKKGETKTITGFDASSCSELGSRTFPVLIKRGAEYNNGEVKTSIASKDAIASFSRKGSEILITLVNSGTCSSGFAVSGKIVNATSGEIYSGPQPACDFAVGQIKSKEKQSFSCTLPKSIPSGNHLKVEITPDGISYYSKEYRIVI